MEQKIADCFVISLRYIPRKDNTTLQLINFTTNYDLD